MWPRALNPENIPGDWWCVQGEKDSSKNSTVEAVNRAWLLFTDFTVGIIELCYYFLLNPSN